MNTHDKFCVNSEGSCCPWMGECSCQCQCGLIVMVREDEAIDCFEREQQMILNCIDAIVNLSRKPGAGPEHYVSALRALLISSNDPFALQQDGTDEDYRHILLEKS